MTTQPPDATEQAVRDVIAAVMANVNIGNRVADDAPATRLNVTEAQAAVRRIINALPSNATTNASLVEALEGLRSFISVMFGQGPDCIIPETVPTPLGVPVKLGAIMRDADTALATLRASNPDEEGKHG